MSDYQTPLTFVTVIDVALLALLLPVAWAAAHLRDLFAVAILTGVYSLVSAIFFVRLDAVDVAFTEAAVGAGISTVLMLSAQLLTTRQEAKARDVRHRRIAALVVIATGAALVYATVDMPAFGDPNSPANAYVGQDYIDRTDKEIGVPNVVTAVLASYRGYDTMGEVMVVFTAAVGVAVIFGVSGFRRRRSGPERDRDS